MELTSRGMVNYCKVWDLNSRRRVGNNKITDVRGQGLIGRQEDFKINPEFNRKPM